MIQPPEVLAVIMLDTKSNGASSSQLIDGYIILKMMGAFLG